MKTSNIILISVFSIVGLFLLSMLIQVEHKQVTPAIEIEAYALPKFSHLKVGRGCYLIFTQGKTDSIQYAYPSETKFEKPLYLLHDDTLIIKDIHKQSFYSLKVFGNQLKSVSIDSARFKIEEINAPNIHINGKTSTITLSNKVFIDTAYFKLMDCTLKSSQAKIKKIELDMEETEIRFDR